VLADLKTMAYQRIRWSKLADLYRLLKYPAYRHSLSHELEFLKKIVKPNLLIFDIGACTGSKTDIFIKLGAHKVIAVEPTPESFKILKFRFLVNKKVEVINKAVIDQNTTKTLFMNGETSVYNTLSQKWFQTWQDKQDPRFENNLSYNKCIEIITITLDELISQFGKPQLIKLDIEGSELQAFKGLSQRVELVWFEANLPEFENETLECIKLLMAINSGYNFNYSINTTENIISKLELKNWINGYSMIKEIKENGYRFMEIFART